MKPLSSATHNSFTSTSKTAKVAKKSAHPLVKHTLRDQLLLPVWCLATKLSLIHITTQKFHITTTTLNLLLMFHRVLKNKSPVFVVEFWDLG